jgi:hypothetical protein
MKSPRGGYLRWALSTLCRLTAASPARTATEANAMVRADKPRLEAALIHSPFSALPKRWAM